MEPVDNAHGPIVGLSGPLLESPLSPRPRVPVCDVENLQVRGPITGCGAPTAGIARASPVPSGTV